MHAISPQLGNAVIRGAADAIPPFDYFDKTAEALRMSERTLERIVERGELRVHYLGGKRIVFIDDLRRYLSNLEQAQPKRHVAAA